MLTKFIYYQDTDVIYNSFLFSCFSKTPLLSNGFTLNRLSRSYYQSDCDKNCLSQTIYPRIIHSQQQLVNYGHASRQCSVYARHPFFCSIHKRDGRLDNTFVIEMCSSVAYECVQWSTNCFRKGYGRFLFWKCRSLAYKVEW